MKVHAPGCENRPVAPLLMAVPNISASADAGAVTRIRQAFDPSRVIDLHSDSDHNRSVFTLAAPQGQLADVLVAGAAAAVAAIDLNAHSGLHPCVGALDVMPVVHLDDERRGAACAEAITAAARVGDELELPVFLYGALATRPEHRERADLRRGGWRALAGRIERRRAGARLRAPRARTRPRARCWPRRGRRWWRSTSTSTATTSSWRGRSPPRSANRRRRGCRGCARSACCWTSAAARRCPRTCTTTGPRRWRAIVEAVRARAPVAEAELVGLAPEAAFDGFPADVPLRDFDPALHLLENALRSHPLDGPDEEEALPQAPRHARRHDRARRTTRQRRQDEGQGRPKAGRARQARRAAQPPPDVAWRGQPRGHRRGRVRRCWSWSRSAASRSRAPPWPCSCSCSTSRSGT